MNKLKSIVSLLFVVFFVGGTGAAEAAAQDFIKGRFEFGADATAVALTYGASATASTKGASATAGDTKGIASWKRGMAVYTLAIGGLMYEASIGGQKFNYRPLNQ